MEEQGGAVPRCVFSKPVDIRPVGSVAAMVRDDATGTNKQYIHVVYSSGVDEFSE